VLTISDHLEWDDKNEHLVILQDKINAYLEAIESGSLCEEYPNAKDRQIVISIVSKYTPNKDGILFLEKTAGFLESAGYKLEFSKIP